MKIAVESRATLVPGLSISNHPICPLHLIFIAPSFLGQVLEWELDIPWARSFQSDLEGSASSPALTKEEQWKVDRIRVLMYLGAILFYIQNYISSNYL